MTETVTVETTEEAVVETGNIKAIIHEKKVDEHGRSYATGKRKTAIARVWLKPGSGKVVVNGREAKNYFPRATHMMMINQPFELTDRENQFDIMCTVKGSGPAGQAGAVRHGISKALSAFEPTLRVILKKVGLITRDRRIVERKKPGRPKARRSRQFSKR